jgi:hypothetical protein
MFVRMSRLFNHKSILCFVLALTLVAAFAGSAVIRGHTANAASGGFTSKSQACAQVEKTIWVSSGAMGYCFGSQPNGPNGTAGKLTHNNFAPNVNAANPSEDVSPNGTRAYGQSEVSTAAIGPYVVEQWNDATAFFSAPCSPSFKDQLSGWGFSSDRGTTFIDQGGLPNVNCATSSWSGDPSVEAWATGGTNYFYQSSLFSAASLPNGDNGLLVAVTACKVSPPSTISCNPNPVVLATNPGTFNFEDKDFMSIDPVRGILYVTFTDFNSPPTFNNIVVFACDIRSNPGNPTCSGPAIVASADPSNFCELEGSYPAVDLATGDVYIAYEFNWGTNLSNFGPCASLPVQDRVNLVSGTCASPVATFPNGCTGPFKEADVNITSMTGAFIPGYNRFPMNDFPRIAVSDPNGTVSIVWNDTRLHPAGDILMQSFFLNSQFPTPVQSKPVRINQATGGWHMLPALRNVNAQGNLNISFYSRASANTAKTDVYAALNVNPLVTSIPSNVLITTGPSDWNSVSSDIVPNFGDYTDNYVIASRSAPFTNQTLFVAWSDGRLGVPQPFNDHLRS